MEMFDQSKTYCKMANLKPSAAMRRLPNISNCKGQS